MQTFLPYPSFQDTAACLDMRRLGKQRVEAMQISMVLEGTVNRWTNHPAVKMWGGYPDVLALYGFLMCSEWRRRGYVDNLREYFARRIPRQDYDIPPWLGDIALHRSHQSNLIRKMPEYYQHLWPDVPGDLPYRWPV